MEDELINQVCSEIADDVEAARESIKQYGATIPKQDIVVIFRDENGSLRAIKTIEI